MRVDWIGGMKVWTAEGGIGETGSTKRDLALDGSVWKGCVPDHYIDGSPLLKIKS